MRAEGTWPDNRWRKFKSCSKTVWYVYLKTKHNKLVLADLLSFWSSFIPSLKRRRNNKQGNQNKSEKEKPHDKKDNTRKDWKMNHITLHRKLKIEPMLHVPCRVLCLFLLSFLSCSFPFISIFECHLNIFRFFFFYQSYGLV